jgi:hypothetical protein
MSGHTPWAEVRRAATSPMRKRAQEITAEYWSVREGGQSERVAVAQLVLALARSETEAAELRTHLAGVARGVMDHEPGAWSDCSPLLCGHPARAG